MTDPENVPRDEFREWAERNNFTVIDREDTEEIIAKAGRLEIMLTEYGNIHLCRRKHLGGESGELTFGEKRLTVVNSRGKEFRVGPGESPI